MRSIDPETDYFFTDSVVREMIDAALTLRILGERPKAERDAIPFDKILEAALLCHELQMELPR